MSENIFDAENLNLVQAFKKAVGLFGRVYDFPVIVQYESGRMDSIASAKLKDIAYDGEAFEVLYAMQDLAFLDENQADKPLSDAEVAVFIDALEIQEAL
jgi:hypothetical protein